MQNRLKVENTYIKPIRINVEKDLNIIDYFTDQTAAAALVS